MNRSRKRAIVSIAFITTSCALFGCGGGGSGSGSGAPLPTPAPMPTPPTNTTSTSLEVFVRDLMNDDQSASPRELNDVPFTNAVREDTFDDVFPA
jgi:hypothetical protein